ncbi:RNA polymerase factor sigma-32 [Polycladidibacter hongkongensis]|uniref:RNA polymerase factor sigma-32 n=1 Tax=Polycladidibacter hongkongensis TaxID=1647556 RepID=UPI00082E70C7|nr:RNA polymerase factor sigma-32 [Pseudovibrio hongkongensis]
MRKASYSHTSSLLVKHARNAPYLEAKEETELARKWREERDQAALSRLATAHIRMVIAQSLRFSNYGLSISDIIQEGHIGLMEAAARFDPEREVRFSTYASWWIKAAIQDYVLRNWSIVRGGTSSSQKTLFFSLRKQRAELAKSHPELSESELLEKLASRSGRKPAEVISMAARLSAPDQSLNTPLTEDGNQTELIERLVSAEQTPDEVVSERLDKERQRRLLSFAMQKLDGRERRIIAERHLSDQTPPTLKELGVTLGISKERVRQIESKALEKLKGNVEEAQQLILAKKQVMLTIRKGPCL